MGEIPWGFKSPLRHHSAGDRGLLRATGWGRRCNSVELCSRYRSRLHPAIIARCARCGISSSSHRRCQQGRRVAKRTQSSGIGENDAGVAWTDGSLAVELCPPGLARHVSAGRGPAAWSARPSESCCSPRARFGSPRTTAGSPDCDCGGAAATAPGQQTDSTSASLADWFLPAALATYRARSALVMRSTGRSGASPGFQVAVPIETVSCQSAA